MPETPEQAKNRKRQLLAIAIVIVGLLVIVGISKLDLGKNDENTAAAETLQESRWGTLDERYG
ncbi:hypothetical protein [Rhodococcus qingshengii]|uniref:hypothetical protein n=1 Tax=Rhodococcus qingshengii TaxID=334542 RepID=UPI001F136CBB|nr:hypothetical protein [Rhodococcus qingshengii]ULD38879.1 hypothetical protein JKI97_00830 [Rhodococcus qingshengii]